MLSISTQPLHVLLISDREDDYLSLQDALIALSSQNLLTWAKTYPAALERLQTGNFDLIVLAEKLGEHTGVSLLQSDVWQARQIPTIALTYTENDATGNRLIQAGATDYLSKPMLNRHILARSIRYVLQQSRILAKLRRNETRYHAIVDGQPDPLIRFDRDFQLTFVNEAYARYRQQPPASLLQTNVLVTLAEADQKQVQVSLSQLDSTQPQTSLEVKMDSDGELIYQIWTIRAVFDAASNPLEYQAVIRDTTQQKRIETELNNRLNELRTLRRVDDELTETLDMYSVTTLALDSAMRLSGADIAVLALMDIATGRLKVEMVYGFADVNTLQQSYDSPRGVIGEVLVSQKSVFIADLHTRPDAVPTTPKMKSQMLIPLISQEQFLGLLSLETRLSDRFTPELFDFLQIVTARISVALDNARLYDLQRAQLEELQALYEQVSQLEQLKTDMIRIASHDLRNPIGVMQGYLEIMEWDLETGGIDTDKLNSHVAAMQKMTSRMRKITTDILSVERIERSTLPDNDTPVNLTTLIHEICDEQITFAYAKSQTFNVYLPDVPTCTLGDGAQLREAVVNLVNNAIKYTPESGTITVTLENDGDAAIFEVSDTGYGIPEDMQSRLFQPFYRAKMRETAQIEGTGLGLHLVKNIIERHRGRMIFRSQYAEGSTFGFQIPVSESCE